MFNPWVEKNKTCPECRTDFQAVLITDATDVSQFVRAVMRLHEEEKKINELQISEQRQKELELAQLREVQLKELQYELEKVRQQESQIRELQKALELAKQEKLQPKLPMGECLSQLTEDQLKRLADKINDTRKFHGNQQTFIRALCEENNLDGNKVWDYFKKKLYEKDFVYQVLDYFSKNGTSIHQLINTRVINHDLMRSMIENVKKRTLKKRVFFHVYLFQIKIICLAYSTIYSQIHLLLINLHSTIFNSLILLFIY